jgi:hypothetical protein
VFKKHFPKHNNVLKTDSFYVKTQFVRNKKLFRNKDWLPNNFVFQNNQLITYNSRDSKQITVLEKVSFCVKTAAFCNIILFRKTYLREKLCLSPLITKEERVQKQLFVSENLGFDVRLIFFWNVIVFRKVSHIFVHDLRFPSVISGFCAPFSLFKVLMNSCARL